MNKTKNKRNRLEIHHHHYIITASKGSNIIIGGTAHNVVSASENSVVMQRCSGDKNTVSNGSVNNGQLTEQEIEMLRLFRSFDMRRKTEAMACLFKIEDRIKEEGTKWLISEK